MSPAFKKQIETLEVRRLLASATLLTGTLRVNGADNVDDTIIVSLNGAGDQYQINVNAEPPQFFARADVKKIIIHGKSGNDTIGVDESRGALGNVLINVFGDDG